MWHIIFSLDIHGRLEGKPENQGPVLMVAGKIGKVHEEGRRAVNVAQDPRVLPVDIKTLKTAEGIARLRPPSQPH